MYWNVRRVTSQTDTWLHPTYMYTAEYTIILCEFKENFDNNWCLYWDVVMLILWRRKTSIVHADHFISLWILGLTEKIMSLDGTTHCLLYGKRTEKSQMLRTVMRTANELIETVTANVTIWTMFFRRTNATFFGVSCAFCKRLLHML
jgi:hypothetical protein